MRLGEDPRWQQLYTGLTCSCGDKHVGMIEILLFWPDGWKHGAKIEPNEALRVDGDFLSDDFCAIEGRYYSIRTVLEIPVAESTKPLTYVCWSMLNSDDFVAYVQSVGRGITPGQGRAFSRLMNRIPGYPDTYALKTSLVTPGGYRRPKVIMEPEDHPLVVDQRQGISIDRLFELYAESGHDMRPALTPN